jgi:hypothetical protein
MCRGVDPILPGAVARADAYVERKARTRPPRPALCASRKGVSVAATLRFWWAVLGAAIISVVNGLLHAFLGRPGEQIVQIDN